MNVLIILFVAIGLSVVGISGYFAYLYKQNKFTFNAISTFIMLSVNALGFAYLIFNQQDGAIGQTSIFSSVIAISAYLSLLIQLGLFVMVLDSRAINLFNHKNTWLALLAGFVLVSALLVSMPVYSAWFFSAGLLLTYTGFACYLYKPELKFKISGMSGLIFMFILVPTYLSAEPKTALLCYSGLMSFAHFVILLKLSNEQFNSMQQTLMHTQQQLSQTIQQKISVQSQLAAEHEAYQHLESEMQSRNFELEVTLRELQEKNNKLEQINTQDGLTGVKNRRYFDERIFAEFRRSRREKSPLSLIMLDIDKFKDINDTHGHLVGDQVIRQTARIIQKQIRRVADCICRYGGEEFAVILPITDLDGAYVFAEQIRESLAKENITTSDVTIKISASLGVACVYANDKNHVDELIGQADKALYQAKQQGRNRTVTAKPNIVRAIHSNR